MSLPALHALKCKAGSSVSQMSRLEELEKEIRDGRCYLGSDSNGCVLRIVHVVILRLFRRDGLLCVKVGDWRREDAKVHPVKAKLPGTKTQAGEMPRQAVERLVKKELEMFRPELHSDQTVEIEQASSETYGVATKYIRTIFSAHVGEEVPLQAMCLPPEHPVDGSLQGLEFFLNPHTHQLPPKAASVYAWVPSADFEYLARAESVGPSFSLMSKVCDEVLHV